MLTRLAGGLGLKSLPYAEFGDTPHKIGFPVPVHQNGTQQFAAFLSGVSIPKRLQRNDRSLYQTTIVVINSQKFFILC